MIIGICGKKNSGKSSCANFILRDIEGIIIPFAQALRSEVMDYLDFNMINYNHMNFYGDDVNKSAELKIPTNCVTYDMIQYGFLRRFPAVGELHIMTYRQLLQWWGTDYRRAMCQDYWLTRWLASVANAETTIIVDDVRFPNEVEAIKKLGGVIIKINRPGIDNHDLHKSETSLDNVKVDITIKNDRSLTEFRKLCLATLEFVKILVLNRN